MAIFGSDKKKKTTSSSASTSMASAPQDQINLIGKGTVFDGTLEAQSDVRASGRVVGNLVVEGKVIITETGVVEGELEASNASIAGTVDGTVRVTELLVLKSTARVEGNIRTGRLVVEEGATFMGECVMGDGRKASGTGTDTPSTKEKRTAPSASAKKAKERSATPSQEGGADTGSKGGTGSKSSTGSKRS